APSAGRVPRPCETTRKPARDQPPRLCLLDTWPRAGWRPWRDRLGRLPDTTWRRRPDPPSPPGLPHAASRGGTRPPASLSHGPSPAKGVLSPFLGQVSDVGPKARTKRANTLLQQPGAAAPH